MGARTIAKQQAGTSRKAERRAFLWIFAAVLGPLLLTYILIAMDMRRDLSELQPLKSRVDSPALLGWATLSSPSAFLGKEVRMLGYMMDGYRPVSDGTPVTAFMLMPEAGQLLHPAHRTSADMVEVRTKRAETVPYRDRSLVWATGQLTQAWPGARKEGIALFFLQDASIQPAQDREISQWFEH